MSMLSMQADELREAAVMFEGYQNGDISRMLREAADTIESLRDRLQADVLGSGTCEFTQIPEALYDDIECGACGVALWGFQMDKVGEGVFATPNYCPYCGARVERREE